MKVDRRAKSLRVRLVDKLEVPVIYTPKGWAQDKVMREMFPLRVELKIPWLTTEFCCVCQTYKGFRYRGVLCDKCNEWVTFRPVIYLPPGWDWDEYDEWLRNNGHFATNSEVGWQGRTFERPEDPFGLVSAGKHPNLLLREKDLPPDIGGA